MDNTVHYHLDGFIAHPGKDCNACRGEEHEYLFNEQRSIKVIARSEEEAWELYYNNKGECFDSDVMFVGREE